MSEYNDMENQSVCSDDSNFADFDRRSGSYDVNGNVARKINGDINHTSDNRYSHNSRINHNHIVSKSGAKASHLAVHHGYISRNISARSKHVIRDSRDYEVMSASQRNSLEVMATSKRSFDFLEFTCTYIFHVLYWLCRSLGTCLYR